MDRFQIINFRMGEAPALMALAWRLRYRVFCEEMGWTIPTADLLEFDDLDGDAHHCVALLHGRAAGYWRLLPTTGPYLLERSFPELLGAPPRSPLLLELSRFALCQNLSVMARLRAGRALVDALHRQGAALGATKLIGVTDPRFARFLPACGLDVTPMTPARTVGEARGRPVEALVVTAELRAAETRHAA
ncbi:MAG TPA: acyl-homoserine-lactone synthase [Azospirillaceae bacterium]|nr:acyl-homoserine-lactone synthase [Azospirillaceae bacterium]